MRLKTTATRPSHRSKKTDRAAKRRNPLERAQYVEAFARDAAAKAREDAVIEAARQRIELRDRFSEVQHEVERTQCLIEAADELIEIGIAPDAATLRRLGHMLDWAKQSIGVVYEQTCAFAVALNPRGAQS